MRVGIDLRPLRSGRSGGIVPLTDGLCRSLFRLAADDSFRVYHAASGHRPHGRLPATVSLMSLPDDDDPARLDACLASDAIDVLFRPFPLDDALAFPRSRQFVVVPDLQHEDHPQFFCEDELRRRRLAFRRAIHEAGAIGLLSRHTYARLRARFPDVCARTVFVPPGPPALDRTLTTPLTDTERRAVPDGAFFLYPANLWPHKNHRRLFQAFERFLHAQSQPFSLVLTGDPTGWPELSAEFPSLPILHLGFVRARLLAELYCRCLALVHFSLYEGFGMPLLEAFNLGAPVLCAEATSLTEVGGDSVLCCDPTDIAAMTGLMSRIAHDRLLQADLRERGRSRLARFDWDRSASDLHQALRQLAAQPARHQDVLEAVRLFANRLAASEDDRSQRLETIVRQNEMLCRLSNYEALLGDESGPLVSVLVPLPDHRGQVLSSVRSWAAEQSLPRDRYEVLVVSDGSDPNLDTIVQQLLGPQDRLIVDPPGNEVRLYDVAARQARGRWLFFTEAHCIGERECLEELVRHLAATGLDGASCRSLGISENAMARMEERVFEEWAAHRLRPDHWSKLFLRGTALSRSVYLEEGGLRWRYGLFAEPHLAALLHARGYQLGHVRAAIVRHCNTTTLATLRHSIGDYVRGECAYRLEHPDGTGDRYFGTPNWWRQRGRLDSNLVRHLRGSVGHSLLTPGRGWLARLDRWLRLLPAAMLGSRPRRWHAAWNVLHAHLRCWWRRHDDGRLLPAYRDLWAALTEQAAVHALSAAAIPADFDAWSARDDFPPFDLPDDWLFGFYPVEEIDGEPFRWSGPLACIKLPLPPGDHRVRLFTRGQRPGVRLQAFFSGRPILVHDCQAECGEIHLLVRREHFLSTPLQYLVLVCDPLRPWLQGAPDRRELGLPLFRILRSPWSDPAPPVRSAPVDTSAEAQR